MSAADCLEHLPLVGDDEEGLSKQDLDLGLDDDEDKLMGGDSSGLKRLGRPVFHRDEAEAALAAMSLVSLATTDGHLVVMRSSFDVRVAGEPYHALMLLLDVGSGRYLARIWDGCCRDLHSHIFHAVT